MVDPTRPFSKVLVPVASPDDGAATAAAIRPYAPAIGGVVGVNVVEKAGGAPDKASVEQAEEHARESLDALAGPLRAAGLDVETDVRYGTDVVDTLVEAAHDHAAAAIVFTPREGGLLVRLLTGDLADRLVHESDVPVVSLPDPTDAADA
jgi:nucleotide-binding universal stress UspA family protein